MDQVFHEPNDNFAGLFLKPQVKITASDVEKLSGADYVEGHNKIDDSYKKDLKKKLLERKSDNKNFEDMKQSDFKKQEFGGYGIFEQLGIKEINTMSVGDFDMDAIAEEYKKLQFNSDDMEDRYQRMMQDRGK